MSDKRIWDNVTDSELENMIAQKRIMDAISDYKVTTFQDVLLSKHRLGELLAIRQHRKHSKDSEVT